MTEPMSEPARGPAAEPVRAGAAESPTGSVDGSADGPAPATATATAHDVFLYYYHPTKAPALREAVLPLAGLATERGLRAHVERHWRFGPHLRLRLEGPAERVAAVARECAEALRSWVAAHPSVADRTGEQLLAEAAVAGRAELIAPPYGPLVPDNTVRTAPADPAAKADLQALLGAEPAELRDELMRAGLPAVRSACAFLGDHGDTAEARVQLVVTALAAHASTHPDGLAGGHYSFLSHLEDFLVHEDPDGRLRAAFDRHWERGGPAVTELVRRVAAGDTRGWERDWAHWSATAWHRSERLLAAGADLSSRGEEYRARAAALGDRAVTERWDFELRTRYSEFHRMTARADPDGTVFGRTDYLIYRTGTNALYRLFAICDVRPLERYLAAHLVVRAVPAVTGHRWQDHLGPAAAAAGTEGAA
ncbi:lantibiotic dehydratase C-terminal domain-containing protein [Kitasatospora sp. NPDC056327]|uniref:lantibiotic dehydratase C-terminal domain-containing protein n=1 Tax=Kitasatospora sp. NPDC056327 TaxID=3345785 RepID=UPI0035DA8F34